MKRSLSNVFCGLLIAAVAAISSPALAQDEAGESSSGSGNTFNARFSPLGLIIGSFNLTLDIAVGEDWTVGPQLSYTDFSVGNEDARFENEGYSAGVRANWFKNGVYTDGLYLGPSITYSKVEATYTDTDGRALTGSAKGPAVSLLAGYGWFWDSFNIMLGLGATANLGDKFVKIRDRFGDEKTSKASTALAGEFSLGWTF